MKGYFLVAEARDNNIAKGYLKDTLVLWKEASFALSVYADTKDRRIVVSAVNRLSHICTREL